MQFRYYDRKTIGTIEEIRNGPLRSHGPCDRLIAWIALSLAWFSQSDSLDVPEQELEIAWSWETINESHLDGSMYQCVEQVPQDDRSNIWWNPWRSLGHHLRKLQWFSRIESSIWRQRNLCTTIVSVVMGVLNALNRYDISCTALDHCLMAY